MSEHSQRGSKMSSIKELPNIDASQVKSSALITSLHDVTIGLVLNSLDASADKISVEVDFQRGMCLVEDNGSGIAAAEFLDSGGLMKPHHTSNTSRHRASHGTNGTFLWAVSSLSDISVISKQPSRPLPSRLTVHHGKTVCRQIEHASSPKLNNSSYGTRVEVRDLFGGMPVRVKQRPVGAEAVRARERSWKKLLKTISGVLLACCRPINFSMQSIASNRRLHIRGCSESDRDNCSDRAVFTPERFFLSRYLKTILVQGASIDPTRWNTWTNLSAHTMEWTIRAIISVEPSPSKAVQFVSLGVYYVEPSGSFSWLYDGINGVFANSSFGSRDESATSLVDSSETAYRARKTDETRQKQPKNVSKSSDRWPMFYIRIDENEEHGLSHTNFHRRTIDERQMLQTISALVERFLIQNNIRLSRQLSNAASPSLAQDPIIDQAVSVSTSKRTPRKISSHIATTKLTRSPSKSKADGRAVVAPSRRSWMKVGSTARASLHTNISSILTSGRPQVAPFAHSSEHSNIATLHGYISEPDFGVSRAHDVAKDQLPGAGDSSQSHHFDKYSETADTTTLSQSVHKMTMAEDKTPWASAVLGRWENPIFKTTEAMIPRLSSPTLDHGRSNGMVPDRSCDADITSVDLGEVRVKVSQLRSAQILSQVDKKFILAKVPVSPPSLSVGNSCTNNCTDFLLLLIDQHAADERVRVEKLLKELCAPVSSDLREFCSPLGHSSKIHTELLSPVIGFDIKQDECSLFVNHAAYFARWGILYALRHDEESLCEKDNHHMIFIKSLPPVILERCRAEPQLLSNLLRNAIWALSSGSVRSSDQLLETVKLDASIWVQIQNCPEGLLNMINSRACRTAVMFNDDLSAHECKDLVKKLASCHLPFQCAHGRPTMVPVAKFKSRSVTMTMQTNSEETVFDCRTVPQDFTSGFKG